MFSRFPITRTTLAWLGAALLALTAVTTTVLAQNGERAAPVDDDENPIVVRLGRSVERLDDFNARFEIAIRSLAANQGVQVNDQIRAQLESLKPQYLEQRATELVLLDQADARGIEADQEEIDATVQRLRDNAGGDEGFGTLLQDAGFENEQQLRDLIAETQRVDALVEALRDELEVTEDELRTYYQANRDQFRTEAQACARHILLESVEDAEAVLEELDGGADFAELAQERSTGPSAPQGGDLGCFARERMVAPFAEAAFEAEVGEPVGPVETDFGQHVILVYDRTEAGVQPFDEVREQIGQQVAQQQVSQRIDALRRGSGVVTFPDRLIAADEDALGPETDPAGEEGAGDGTDETDETDDAGDDQD